MRIVLMRVHNNVTTLHDVIDVLSVSGGSINQMADPEIAFPSINISPIERRTNENLNATIQTNKSDPTSMRHTGSLLSSIPENFSAIEVNLFTYKLAQLNVNGQDRTKVLDKTLLLRAKQIS